MTLTLSPSVVPAGDVTFIVKNNGTIDHEAVVLKTTHPLQQTPHHRRRRPTRPRQHTAPTKSAKPTNIGETGDPNLKPGTPAPSPSNT